MIIIERLANIPFHLNWPRPNWLVPSSSSEFGQGNCSVLVYCSTAELTAVFQSGASIHPDKLQKIVRYFTFSQQKTPCFPLLISWIRFLVALRSLLSNKITSLYRVKGVHIEPNRFKTLLARLVKNGNGPVVLLPGLLCVGTLSICTPLKNCESN